MSGTIFARKIYLLTTIFARYPFNLGWNKTLISVITKLPTCNEIGSKSQETTAIVLNHNWVTQAHFWFTHHLKTKVHSLWVEMFMTHPHCQPYLQHCNLSMCYFFKPMGQCSRIFAVPSVHVWIFFVSFGYNWLQLVINPKSEICVKPQQISNVLVTLCGALWRCKISTRPSSHVLYSSPK